MKMASATILLILILFGLVFSSGLIVSRHYELRQEHHQVQLNAQVAEQQLEVVEQQFQSLLLQSWQQSNELQTLKSTGCLNQELKHHPPPDSDVLQQVTTH